MTDESRQLLLDYFMGLAPSESGKNEPILKANQNKINNYQQFITDNVPGGLFTAVNYLQQKNSGKTLIYGYYFEEQSGTNIYYGAIIIFDENMQPIKCLTKYNTGTLFRKFEMLGVAEDGTLYGVDNNSTFNADYSINKYRFIMLNDILQSGNVSGNYQTILRQSYNFPEEYNKIFFGFASDQQYRLIKKPNESEYLFIGRDDTNVPNLKTAVLRLKVNVGQSNEWKIYRNDIDLTGRYVATYAKWSEDNLYLKICGWWSLNDNEYVELTLENETITKTYQLKFQDSSTGIDSVTIIGSDNVYLGTSLRKNDNYISKILKLNKENNTFTELYSNEQPAVYLGNTIDLKTFNNLVFVKYSIWTGEDFDFKIQNYLGVIIDDKYYQVDVGETPYYQAILNLLFVKSEFNLYTIMTQGQSFIQSAKLVYNQSNYNGLPYQDKNSLIANSGEIYSNDEIVFARNLYNKTLNENTTVSTIEIPNTYLNDIDLTSKNLVSKTNTNIVEDTNVVRKNIYETVFLNFINTVGIAYRTDNEVPLKFTLNKNESTVLNNSINNPTDYNQIKFTKARLNYQDGSNKIVGISVEKQIKDNYLAKITFYVDKEVNNVDWISEDENHVYYVSDVSNCEVGKTYSLDTLVRKGSEINGFKYN